MSVDYSYGYYGGMEDRTRSRYGTASSKKIEKGLKRLLILAGIILIAQLVWLFGISPCIPFTTVEVHGFEISLQNRFHRRYCSTALKRI